MIKVQLGPWKGTDQWKRGSIIATVLMRKYGSVIPADWKLPDDLTFLAEMQGDKPFHDGGIDWPMRAIWSDDERDFSIAA